MRGRLGELDIAHLAEEIDDMGKSTRRELFNRLALLFMHLLKWEYQPSRQGNSWRATIKEQRRAILKHLRENPSLKNQLNEMVIEAYSDAVVLAVKL